MVLALWLISRERFVAAGAAFGAALALKESAVLAVAPVLLAVAVGRGWKRAIVLLAGPITVVGLWVAKNIVVYGWAFETFQAFRFGDPYRGAIGVLLDPRHGVLVFAPVVVLMVAGMPRILTPREALTDPVAVAWLVMLLYLALTSCWVGWQGGSCYGPRLIIPAIAAAAVPLAEAWRRWRSRALYRSAFATLLIAGFTIQLSAACKPYHLFWSPSIVDVLTATVYGPVAGVIIGSLLASFLMRRLNRGSEGRERAS